jgi:hypothetical protein
MFIPVGQYVQYIQHIDKDADGNVTEKQVMGVSVSQQTTYPAQDAHACPVCSPDRSIQAAAWLI